MVRKNLFLLCFIIICITASGQTNDSSNKITISGQVYYYYPSSTPSSTQPQIEKTGFITEGSWYGEEAAKAWSSILKWTIENCRNADSPVNIEKGDKVYIHQVHAYRNKTPNGMKHIFGELAYYNSPYARHNAAVKVLYWVVPENETLEQGRREYRRFWFD